MNLRHEGREQTPEKRTGSAIAKPPRGNQSSHRQRQYALCPDFSFKDDLDRIDRPKGGGPVPRLPVAGIDHKSCKGHKPDQRSASTELHQASEIGWTIGAEQAAQSDESPQTHSRIDGPNARRHSNPWPRLAGALQVALHMLEGPFLVTLVLDIVRIDQAQQNAKCDEGQ